MTDDEARAVLTRGAITPLEAAAHFAARDLLDCRAHLREAVELLREAQQVDIASCGRIVGYEYVTQDEVFWERFRPIRERIDRLLALVDEP